jgi:hypothetical protein
VRACVVGWSHWIADWWQQKEAAQISAVQVSAIQAGGQRHY